MTNPSSQIETKEKSNCHYRFIESTKKWLPYLHISRERDTSEWFSFIQHLCDSASAFYSFHRTFIREYRDLNEDINNDHPLRIYNFYADLTVSRLKKAIFTENPRDSIRDASGIIFEEFNDAFEFVSKTNINEIKKYELYYFYLKAFCYFDIVYSKTKPEAFFTRFMPERKIREKFLSQLKSLGEKVKELNNQREFNLTLALKIAELKNILINSPLYNTIDSVKHYNSDFYNKIDNNSPIIPPESIYDPLFPPVFDPSNFAFDPLSRFYSCALWKCIKILDSSSQYIKSEDNERFINEFKEAFLDYLKNLQEYLDSDNKAEEIMNLLLNNDYKFIENFLLKNVLSYPRDANSNNSNTLDSIPLIFKINSPYKERNTTEEIDINRFKEIACQFYVHNELTKISGPWRFENFILNGTEDDIQYLMEYVATIIHDSRGGRGNEHKENGAILSVLQSGSLIAYLYNLITGNTSKIMHFKPTPYITITPYSVKLPESFALLFDESFKSGFTYDLIKEYVRRKAIVKEFKPIFLVLAKVLDYKPRGSLNNMRFIYSWNHNTIQTMAPESYLVADYFEKFMEYRKGLYSIFERLRNLKVEDDIIAKVEEMTLIGKNKGRRDVVRLFTSEESFFTLSKYFYNRIIEKADEKSLMLVYGSDYAYLVALSISLFLKADRKKNRVKLANKLPEQNEENAYNAYKVFIDLEIFTGNTLSTRANNKKFNMVCSIVTNEAFKNNKEKWLEAGGEFVNLLYSNLSSDI